MFDPERLRACLADVRSWSAPSTLARSGVHHGYSRAPAHPYLWGWVFAAFEAPVWLATLTKLEPGGFILPHRDAGPYLERWQVPIITAGSWGDGFVPEPGAAHRVTHWEPHSVWNTSDTARVVLLVDLDREVHPSGVFEGPFPVPSKFAHLVEAAGLGPQ